jgi:hypothetical protein
MNASPKQALPRVGVPPCCCGLLFAFRGIAPRCRIASNPLFLLADRAVAAAAPDELRLENSFYGLNLWQFRHLVSHLSLRIF